MLCPCCGVEIQQSARECRCGARFVGAPLDEKPVKIQSYGAVMIAAGLLALVTVSALVFTKFLAFGAVLVIWSARRAMKLAKGDPQSFGGFKTATAMLLVTVIAGSVAAGYTVTYIPRFLENREIKKKAAVQASMLHVAVHLNEYKLANNSYPRTWQDLEKFAKEPIPADVWEQTIAYTGFTEAMASVTTPLKDTNNREILQTTGVGLNHQNFVLRSNGPDGKAETEDDIIMVDGIFYTYEESKRMPLVKPTPGQ